MGTRVCVVVFFFVVAVATAADDTSFEGCLRKDSVSCIQQHVYRKLRAVFGMDTINLLGGFQLVKNTNARSIEDNLVDDQIFGEVDVPERQTVLESFAFQGISNFFNERSWQWSITPAIEQLVTTARMVATNVPKDLRETVTSYVFEGRGRKKAMKSLMPLLVLAKIKLGSLLALSTAAVAVVAKKALFASILAIVIMVFTSVKKLLAKHHLPYHYDGHTQEIHHTLSHADRSGWAPASTWSSWDSYNRDAGSHHLAYTQKPKLR